MDVLLLIAKIYLWFMTFGVAGWIYEVIYFFFTDKKFINRGFLFGPLCPIYGIGSLAFYGVFGLWLHIDNIILLFFLGGILACTLEYCTAFVLENIFHTKWWDYSNFKINFQGRICLLGFLAFSSFCVIVVKWIFPAIINITNLVNPVAIIICACIVGAFTTTDLIFTTIHHISCKKSRNLGVEHQGFVEKHLPKDNIKVMRIYTRLKQARIDAEFKYDKK